ncbi:UDP-N-acetylmuramate dehydrogenase [Candidatus Igneacidithiobacillus taiwanensis]|uniref:UDP-N-acetylmuramate dehydrogenase n=1 Tax=Candidatus Igneacidithiobacillus taiwanensis TaxID=1945924 RepID=UPI002899AC1D|nr:UDP-N-acetylmuramate dehydrogenase [Candidatus Igneacidithiobacillus taiwanensis]
MIGGRLRLGESLARHSSWRIGGPAERFYLPATIADLQGFLQQFATAPITWLGLGSNVLLRDGGLRGTVICLAHGLDTLTLGADGEIIAEAGISAVKLAHFAARNGLAGAEFLAGIPGTLGGCLAMNAGAHGGETWSLVEWVELMHPNGDIERRPKSAFVIGYRSVRGQGDACFLRAGLRLPAGEPELLRAQLRAWQNQRAATQPLAWPSCGSVFRNPAGDFAARLIEAAGLKGRRIGDAEVSEQHANFIINRGQASSRAVEALVMEVQETVRNRFGVLLQPEMRVLGEHQDD